MHRRDFPRIAVAGAVLAGGATRHHGAGPGDFTAEHTEGADS